MKNSRLKKILTILLLVFLVISVCGMVIHEINYYRAQKSYMQASDIASLPTVSRTEAETDETEVEEETEPEVEEETEPAVEPETEPAVETEAEEKPETEPAAEPEQEPETEPETKPEPKPQPKPEEDSVARSLLDTDLSSLQEINKDVFGWIMIPDTTISYPLLQGGDNSYYLNHSWEGSWNPVGSIYLDYRNAQDFSDFHTIIYGHRMYNDSMFNSLQHYKDADYLEEHPYVYVLHEEGVLRYRVFSVYKAKTDSPAWRLGLERLKDQQLLIDYFIQESVVEAEVRPLSINHDDILTLSTCSQAGASENRWVVHCFLDYVLPREKS